MSSVTFASRNIANSTFLQLEFNGENIFMKAEDCVAYFIRYSCLSFVILRKLNL